MLTARVGRQNARQIANLKIGEHSVLGDLVILGLFCALLRGDVVRTAKHNPFSLGS